MSVRPVDYSAEGIAVWHDDQQHGGTVPWDDVHFAKQMDGSPDERFILLPCPYPGCGAVSTHPVSGGADPDAVPLLFVRKYLNDPDVPDVNWRAAVQRARHHSQTLEPGRWRDHFEDEEDDERVPIRRRGQGGAVVTERPGQPRPPKP